MDDYDPACPTEDESQLMELDLSQVPLPPSLPTQSKTRSKNYSKQKSSTSDKEDDKKSKKRKRKRRRHGRGQDGEEEEHDLAPNITEPLKEPADLSTQVEKVTEREEKPQPNTSSSQLPGDQVKADIASAPSSSDATSQTATAASRSSGRLQFKLAPDPASGKAKVLFQLNKPLKVSALRVASDEEEEKEEAFEEEEKQIIEKTAAGEYVPTRFKVSKKHEMYKPNLLGPGLTVVFNTPSIGTALGSVQPGSSGGSNQPATSSKDGDGNSRGDLRKNSDEVRKKKEEDEAQALPLRRSERRRSRDTREQEKESDGGSRSGRFDRSLDRRDNSRGARSRSQKDEDRRDDSRRGKVDPPQDRRRSSRFQKDQQERKDKDMEGGRRHQHRRQDTSVGDRRTRNSRRSRSGSRDRKRKSLSQSPRRSTAKVEEVGQNEDKSGTAVDQDEDKSGTVVDQDEDKSGTAVDQDEDKSGTAVDKDEDKSCTTVGLDEDKSGLALDQPSGSPPDNRLQELSPTLYEENTKAEEEPESNLGEDPCQPAKEHSYMPEPSSEVEKSLRRDDTEKPVQEITTETKCDTSFKLESSDSEGGAKKAVQKLVIRRSFDTNDFQVTRNDLADAEESTKVEMAESGSVLNSPVKSSPSSKIKVKNSQRQSPAAEVEFETDTRGTNSGSNAGRRKKENKEDRGKNISRRGSLRRQRSNSTDSDGGHKEKATPGSKKSPSRRETTRGRPSGFRVDEPALPPEQVLVDVSAIPGKSKWEMEDEEEAEPAEDAYKNNIYGNYRAEQEKPVAKAYEVSWRRSARLQMGNVKKSKTRESSSNDDDFSQERHKGREKKRHIHKSKVEKKTRRKKKKHEGGSSTEEQVDVGEKRKPKRDDSQEEERKVASERAAMEAKRKEASIKAKSGLDTAKLVTYLKEYSEKEEFVLKEEAPKAKAELDNSKIVSYLKEYSEMMSSDQERVSKSDVNMSPEENIKSSRVAESIVVSDFGKPELSVLGDDSQFSKYVDLKEGDSVIPIINETTSTNHFPEGEKMRGSKIEEVSPPNDKRTSVSNERVERVESKSLQRSHEDQERSPENAKDKRDRSKSTERNREKERSKSLEAIGEKGGRSQSPERNRSKRNRSKSIEKSREKRERTKSPQIRSRERSKSSEKSRVRQERSKSAEKSREREERSKTPERARLKRERSKSTERSRYKKDKSAEKTREKQERSKSTERFKRERSKSIERSRDKRERSKSTERSKDKRERSKSHERNRDKRDRSRSVDRNRRNQRSKSPKPNERSRSSDRRFNRRSRSPYFRSRGRRNRSKSGSPERKDYDRKNRSRSRSFERGRFSRRHRSPDKDMYGRGRRDRDRWGRSHSNSRDRNLDVKKHGAGHLVSSSDKREKEDIVVVKNEEGKSSSSTDAEFLTANIDLSTIPIPAEIPLPGEVVKNEPAVVGEAQAPIDVNVDDESMEISDEDDGRERKAEEGDAGQHQGKSEDETAGSKPETLAKYVNPATLSAGKDRQIKFSIVGPSRKLKPAGMTGLLDDLSEPQRNALVCPQADDGHVGDSVSQSTGEDFKNTVSRPLTQAEETDKSHSTTMGIMGHSESVDVSGKMVHPESVNVLVSTKESHEAFAVVIEKEGDFKSDNLKPQMAEREENKDLLVPQLESQKDEPSVAAAQPAEKPSASVDEVVALMSDLDKDEEDAPSKKTKRKVAPAPQRLKFKYVPLWEMEETEKRPVIEVSTQKAQSTISLALDYGSGSSDYEDENGSPIKRKSPARSDEITPVKLSDFETRKATETVTTNLAESHVVACDTMGEISSTPGHVSNAVMAGEVHRGDAGADVKTSANQENFRPSQVQLPSGTDRTNTSLQEKSKTSSSQKMAEISLEDNPKESSLLDNSEISPQDKSDISTLQDKSVVSSHQDKSVVSSHQDKSVVSSHPEKSVVSSHQDKSVVSSDKSDKSTLQDNLIVSSHQVKSSCEKVVSDSVDDQEAYSPSHPSLEEDTDDSTDLPAVIPYPVASKHNTDTAVYDHGRTDAVTSGLSTEANANKSVDLSTMGMPHSVPAPSPVSAHVGATPSKDLPYVSYPHIPLPSLLASTHSSGIQSVLPSSIPLPSMELSKIALPTVGVAPVPPPTVAPVPPPAIAPVLLPTVAPVLPLAAPIQTVASSATLLPVTYPTLPFPSLAPRPVPPPQVLAPPLAPQPSAGSVSSLVRPSPSQSGAGLQGIPLPGMVMPPIKAFQPVLPPVQPLLTPTLTGVQPVPPPITGVQPVPPLPITGVLPVPPLPVTCVQPVPPPITGVQPVSPLPITGVQPVPPLPITGVQPVLTSTIAVGMQPQLITSFPVLTAPLLAPTSATSLTEPSDDPTLTQQPPVKFRINRFHQGPAGVVPPVIPPPTVSIPTLSVARLASEGSSQDVQTTSYPTISVTSLTDASPTPATVQIGTIQKHEPTAGATPSRRPKISSILSQPKIEDPKLLEMLVKSESDMKSLTGSFTLPVSLPETLARDILPTRHEETPIAEQPMKTLYQRPESSSTKALVDKGQDSAEKISTSPAEENLCLPPQAADRRDNSGAQSVQVPEELFDKSLLFAENIDFDMDSIPLPASPPLRASAGFLSPPRPVDVGQGISLPSEPPVSQTQPPPPLPVQGELPRHPPVPTIQLPTAQSPIPLVKPPIPAAQPPIPAAQLPIPTAQPLIPHELQTQPPMPPFVIADSGVLPPLPPPPMSPKSQTLGSLLAERKKRFSQSPLAIGMLPKVPLTQSPLAIGPLPKLTPEPEASTADIDASAKKIGLAQDIKTGFITADGRKAMEIKTKEPLQLATTARPKMTEDKEESKSSLPGLSKIHIVLKSKSAVQRTVVRGFEDEGSDSDNDSGEPHLEPLPDAEGVTLSAFVGNRDESLPPLPYAGGDGVPKEEDSSKQGQVRSKFVALSDIEAFPVQVITSSRKEEDTPASSWPEFTVGKRREDVGGKEEARKAGNSEGRERERKKERRNSIEDDRTPIREERRKKSGDDEEERREGRRKRDEDNKRRSGDYEESGGKRQVKKEKDDEGYNDRRDDRRSSRGDDRQRGRYDDRTDDSYSRRRNKEDEDDYGKRRGKDDGRRRSRGDDDRKRSKYDDSRSGIKYSERDRSRERSRDRSPDREKGKRSFGKRNKRSRERSRSRSPQRRRERDRSRDRYDRRERDKSRSRSDSRERKPRDDRSYSSKKKDSRSFKEDLLDEYSKSSSSVDVQEDIFKVTTISSSYGPSYPPDTGHYTADPNYPSVADPYAAPPPTSVDAQAAYTDPNYVGQYPPSYEHQQYGPAWQTQPGHDVYAQDVAGQYQEMTGQYQPPDHSAPPPHQYPFHQPHPQYPQQPVYHAGPFHLPPTMPPQQLSLPHLQQPGGVQPPHIPPDQHAQSGAGHFASTQQHIPSYSAPPPTHLQPPSPAHFGHSDSQFHVHSGAIRGPILPPPRAPLLQTPSIPRNVMDTPTSFGSPRFPSPDPRSSPGLLKPTEVKAVRKSRFSPADPVSLKAVVSTSVDLHVSGTALASPGVGEHLKTKPYIPEPSFENSSLAEVEFDTAEKQDGRGKSKKKSTQPMAEDVNEPTVSSSGVEDTTGDTGSDSGTESSLKPLKVKSRWRRNSEAEAVVDTSTPLPVSTPNPALTARLSGQQGSTSSPALDSSPKEMRRTRSRAAAEELGGGTPSMETPPPPPPLRKRIKLDMAGAEEKADDDSSRSDEDVSNGEESPQDMASIIKRPDFPRFEIIMENIHLTERKRSKSMKRMLCDCTTSREDRAMGIEACGSDCLNRMLMIECGARCPCGEYCTNRRFQKKIYSKTLPFSAGDKGWGLRADEDMEEKGTFIMEYVGELLDYEEFVRRTKQYSKAGLKHHYFMALNADEVVDATLRGNISRFINHSCDPNCETQKWTVNGELRVGFFTRKEIKKGEELTFDYQFEHYGEPQKCYCGSENCRGYIGLVKSPTKNNKKKERKKREIFKDELLEEDIEKLSMLDGMRNKNHVLELCRLMVRAEKVQHRIAILKILQETTETACLRLFLDYHGLPLYWSWMADIGTADYSEDTQELKLLMLSVLKCLPITNKTVLKESKILDIVERWAVAAVAAARKPPPPPPPTSTTTSVPALPQPVADSADVTTEVTSGDNEADATFETTASGTAAAEPEPSASSSETTPPSSPPPPLPIPVSNVTPVSILASAKETKEAKQKRRVTFAEVHVETAFSPEPDEDMEETDDISSSTQYSEESRDEAMSQEGVSLLKSQLPGEATPVGMLDLDLSSSAADSTSQKDSFDGSVGDSTGLSSDTDNSDTESVIKDPLASLAAECMSQWSSLKEVFKIPKKERVEERKRTEMELDVLSKKQPEASDPYAKWKRGRSRAFVRKKLPEDEERKSNLPRMTKEERRQRFEAQVKAEDEMAAQAAAEEYQRQQEAYMLHQQRLLEDPTYFYNYMQQQGDFAVMDPSVIPQEGMIDPVTGQPIPQEALIDAQTGQHFIDPSGQQIIDPNTGQPLLQVDPNTGQPLLQIDPNTGQALLPIDPNTGQPFLQIDPNTGQPLLQIDPNTGQPLLQIDPNTGQHMVHHQIDLQTGQPIDPHTGQPIHHIDPHTGHPIDPSIGQPIDPSTGQPIQQLVPHSGQQQIATTLDQQIVQAMAHHVIDPHTVQPVSADPHTGHLIQHSVLSYPAQSLPSISHHQTEFTSQQPKTQHMPKTASNLSLSELDMEEEVPPPPSPPTIPVTKLPPNWKTAKDNEGRVYYYHAFTRQTQWEMPSWDEDEDSANDMDLDPLPPEEIIRQSKKKTTTAAADTSSEVARKIKDSFRIKMSDHIILYLNPYRKKDCKIGRISSTEDFKHLARKLTHHVMSKELKHCRHVEDLEVNENVKAKAKDYVRKYMSKFGTNYKKSSSPQPD